MLGSWFTYFFAHSKCQMVLTLLIYKPLIWFGIQFKLEILILRHGNYFGFILVHKCDNSFVHECMHWHFDDISDLRRFTSSILNIQWMTKKKKFIVLTDYRWWWRGANEYLLVKLDIKWIESNCYLFLRFSFTCVTTKKCRKITSI